ncbi:haeIIM [Symbiodinium microadriaticum]|nr:haeIIM [Symbiodinium microadriaticum]CAE7947906.1 haeIIM [Symbiodinium sp. KB8]
MALRRLKIKFRSWFASEIEDRYREVYCKLHPETEIVYTDCTKRSLAPLAQERSAHPTAYLIYCAGFPCQPFSSAGLHLGSEDSRSNVLKAIMSTIRALLPNVVLLENVAELVTNKNYEDVKNYLFRELGKIGGGAYQISHKVMDSHEYGGVPAKRRRVYVVATLTPGQCAVVPMVWPSPIEAPPLKSILEHRKPGQTANLKDFSNTFLNNLSKGMELIKKKSPGGWKVTDPWVVDLAPSEKYGPSVKFNCFPTITVSHANSYYVLCKKDLATCKEILAAQGIQWSDLRLAPGVSISERTLKCMAGNAFTLTLVERIFQGVLSRLLPQASKSK